MLAGQLSAGLDQLLGSDAPERGRITVEHLHKTAFDLVRRAGGGFQPIKPDELDALLGEGAAAADIGDVTLEFLRAEWDSVVDY